MHELAGGLWTWTGRHPDWNEDEDWGPDVRSYAVEKDEEVVLIDPITPPRELMRGDVKVALTCAWHKRSAPQLGAPISGYGDETPMAINAQPAFFPEERTLWIPAHSALVVGDSLSFDGHNVRRIPDEWLKDSSAEEYNAKLRPLLDLPIEMILPTHGDPIVEEAHAKLERALS